MSDHFTAVLPNVFLFRDTCNVYVLRAGEEAILVDFGSGHVLDHLAEIRVARIAALLHTHHHRDQAQGDALAGRAAIPITVPVHERHLFDQVETFWTTKQLFDVYDVRNTYFSLISSVPVSGVLEDYDRYAWKDVRLEVLPTPGHTMGSISLVGAVDGVDIAFCGDLLHSPGKVQTLFDLQYAYGSVDGVESTILSLNLLESRAPAVLCPSHGEVMRDVRTALNATRTNLRSFYRLMTGGKLAVDEVDFTPVASRILHATERCSSFYAILSRDGTRALFVDYGAPNYSLFQPVKMQPGERVRFIHHSLERLHGQYGVKEIEAVIPSHYHDDHINGIPYLQRTYGTQVWAYENMKEILENPRGELIGCVMPDPLKVERTFRDHERFRWEGIDFEVYFSPGHCDYHMSMFTEMDGKRIAFSGDNVWPPMFIPSLIYRNHVHRTSHQRTARLYDEYRPAVLCSGHGLYTNIAPEAYRMFLANTERLTELFDALLPAGSGATGIEPSWMQIYPYQSKGEGGTTIALEVRIANPLAKEATVAYRWVLPEGWTAAPDRTEVSVAAGKQAREKTAITIPQGYRFPHPKQAIALDVELDGRHLGQIVEGVVENRPYGPGSLASKG